MDIGDEVLWDGEKWFIDNTDEEFKDEDEEISAFILPIKYADQAAYDVIFESGQIDNLGYWVYISDLTKA